MGLVCIALGGGRHVESDKIDPSVGLSDILGLGSWVERGEPILRIHAAREAQARDAEAILRDAISLGPTAPDVPPLVHERIG